MSSTGGGIHAFIGGRNGVVLAVVALAVGAITIPTVTGGGGSLPPLGQPSCQPGAVNVTTAAAVRTQALAGNNVCLTASVGAVDLQDVNAGTDRYIGTTGSGAMGVVDADGSTHLVLSVRATSLSLWDTQFVTVQSSLLGGTSGSRTLENVIMVACCGTTDLTIQDTEIAWTTADFSGNAGYGIRQVGGSGANTTRTLIRRNYIHHIGGDAIQGFGDGADVVIDRNEIAYVAQPPSGSDEHSDLIQDIEHGSGFEITNNWLHHQGWWDETTQTANSGIVYVHGDSVGDMLMENNLMEDSLGRTEICNLGSGTANRSNVTIRNNTVYDNGTWAGSFPGFEWDCDTGSSNLVERNVFVDPDGGFAQNGSSGTFTDQNNLKGVLALVTLNADGDCTSANCTGSPTIGYRKPSGVHW